MKPVDIEKCKRFIDNIYRNGITNIDYEFTDEEVAYIKETWSSLVIINGNVMVMTWNRKNKPVFTKPK